MDTLLHKWQINLYPLRVLYDPTLRLRYRVTWEREARLFNRNLGVTVFREPELAEYPPNMAQGMVYIEDARNKDLAPHIFVNFEAGKAVSAIVQLPVNESNSESCPCVVREAISLLFSSNL